jgi:hypothetical protein
MKKVFAGLSRFSLSYRFLSLIEKAKQLVYNGKAKAVKP